LAAPDYLSVDRTTCEAGTLRIALAPLARGDLATLCGRAAALLEASPGTVVICNVSALPPDAVAIDALARLQLTVRRARCWLLLEGARAELVGLIVLFGLSKVLRRRPEPEQREEAIRVQKRVERHDPPV